MQRLCIWIVCLCFAMTGCAQDVNNVPDEGTILIDPGHGGFDGGAVAIDGTTEKHINLAVALRLYDYLYVCGFPVSMTRQSDVGLEDSADNPIRAKKVADMRKRLEMYQQASLVISIHQNHFTQPQYDGTQLFYSPNHPQSIEVARAMRTSVVQLLQSQNRREIKKATDGIYLLHHSQVPTVLVECGFLSNPDERDLLKTPIYQQQIAFALLAGYWNYVQK